MKIFVVTNAKGQVVASSPMMPARYPADAPAPGRPTPLRGQRVDEIDVPAEFQGIKSAVELHQRLRKLIPSRRSKKPTRVTTSKKRTS